MKSALDTDVLTLILAGYEPYRQRVDAIAVHHQYVPIVTREEQIRGRLNVIRQSESGKAKLSLPEAYGRLQDLLQDSRRFQILPFTPDAQQLVETWRAARIRVGTQDLRIAAICIAQNAKLVSRNKRDYEQVPGLTLEVWN